MQNADFEVLLDLLSRLSVEQRWRVERALAANDSHAAVCEVIERRLGERPCCAHCGGDRVGGWGRSHGLRRWRCGDCRRTFNALTGTTLARLRKKALWLAFAETLSDGLSVRKAAECCGVAPSTSFRWRHRFLRTPIADRQPLRGMIETDETFFRLSCQC